jgi:hypothetical protein
VGDDDSLSEVEDVWQGGNVTQLATQTQMCASFIECASYSVPTTIVLEATRPEYSTVALRPSLWFDDFVNWLDPGSPRWSVHDLPSATSALIP